MVHRGWCWTLFELDCDVPAACTPENLISYGIFQLEECPDTHRVHVQGYFEFVRGVRFTHVSALFGQSSPHLEPRRGSAAQASAYCRKPGGLTEPTEFGQHPPGQGARSDLETIQAALDDGANPQEIARAHFPTWARSFRAIDRYFLDNSPRRAWPMAVHVRFGVTGSGKTHGVYAAAEQAGSRVYDLASPNTNGGSIWFDGYEQEDVILIDDFYGWLPWTFLLKLLDHYPLRVQSKGHTVPFLGRTIYITSNQHPRQWYNYGGHMHYAALERRFTTITEFTDAYVAPTLPPNTQIE